MAASTSTSDGTRTRAARGPLRIGRLRGIPLYLHPLFPVLLAAVVAVAWIRGSGAETLVLLAAVLLAVAIHELAHAWMARRRGLPVPGIVVNLVSVTWVARGSPHDEWRVALAAPLASLVVGVALGAVRAAFGPLPEPTLGAYALDPLALFAAANAAVGFFNLAPVLPADGGRALRAYLRARGAPRAARWVPRSLNLGAGAGCVLVAILLASWPASALAGAMAALMWVHA